MVEVTRITAASFRRSHDAPLPSAPPALQRAPADPRPPETPGHSQESLGQSPVGSVPLSPGPWCPQGFVCCALQESVSPVRCKPWRLYGGLMVTSSKRAPAIPGLLRPEPLPLQQSTADAHLLRHSTQCRLCLCLCGISENIQCKDGLDKGQKWYGPNRSRRY